MKLSKYVKFREERFGGVVFETRSEKVYTLNPSAAAVLREIEEGTDERDIPARVQARFEYVGGAIQQEVTTLIAELRQKGLVED
jgi:hypothetical protein